jgi:hypothetical protein
MEFALLFLCDLTTDECGWDMQDGDAQMCRVLSWKGSAASNDV